MGTRDLPALAGHDEVGIVEAQSVYFNCHLALRNSDPLRARQLLRQAHAVVMAQANSISNPNGRTQFLSQMTINREVMAAQASAHAVAHRFSLVC